MSIDPFSDLTSKKSDVNEQISASKTGLLAFFLCSFDTTRGLQILFSSPRKLQKNRDELDILKTHCVWKIEKIPLRIDLKFSDFIYSAFQLHGLLEEEITATKEKPLYGIVFKILKDSIQIPIETLNDFKFKIELEEGSNLSTLSKQKLLESNPIKRKKYKLLTDKSINIHKHLEYMWKEFKNQIIDSMGQSFEVETLSSDNFALLPTEVNYCSTDYFKRKIAMRTATTIENPDQLLVMLLNQTEKLKDVIIQVSKVIDLFSETIWVQEVPEWPLKEELVLEFSKSDIDENYLIKITSRRRTIDIKSLELKA
ncbi:MAG: hypothetical protein ACW964_00630 [Candidatus Hodarchaeales archaeon]|jgi:hypothetical protein